MERFSLNGLHIRPQFSLQGIMLFWYRYHRLFFGVLFVCVLIFSVWQWYASFYGHAWSDTEKKSFLTSYVKETDFKSDRFGQNVQDFDMRKTRFDNTPVLEHDIFRLDKETREKSDR